MSPRIEAPKFFCRQCGQEIERKRIIRRGYSRGFEGRIKFCSKSCAQTHRWKDCKGYIHHGYRYFNVGGKGIAEHTIVMERTLGRKMLKGETVHHKDGDRLNNHSSNLELWTSRHGKGQRAEDRVKNAIGILNDYGIPFTPPNASDLMVGALSIGG